MEAPTGTGKTTSLCMSALQIIDPSVQTCQVLVLTSSFDAAQRIQKTAVDLGQYMQMLDRPASVGRPNIDDDISTLLHGGQQFVAGPPDRVLELIQHRAITTESTKLLVLDKGDKIVPVFIEQILAIHQLVPSSVQVVCLSVTRVLQDVPGMSSILPHDHLHIVINKKPGRPFEGVKQYYIATEIEDQKLSILSPLCSTLGPTTQVLIFCNTRRKVSWLASQLKIPNSASMHADMDACDRAEITKSFRSGSTRVLLATNTLAWGLVVRPSSLLIVINYEVPAKLDEYVHRTSYDGRLGSKDTTINVVLVVREEVGTVREMERHHGTQIEETSVPLLMQAVVCGRR